MASNVRVFISRSVVFDEEIFPFVLGLFDGKKDSSKLGFQSLLVLVHPSGVDFTTVAEGCTDSLSVGQNASETVASVQERASLSTPQPSHDSEGSEVPSAATNGADHTESPQGNAFQQANSLGADFQRADSQGAGCQRADSQRTVVQDAESSERVIGPSSSACEPASTMPRATSNIHSMVTRRKNVEKQLEAVRGVPALTAVE
ncbi:hypothetical protein V6N11_050876 [Hibiscus sabdariffa]|uniref:Uncharacterized protein n=1 Tax=Hibiscus sabdariffa TaxID=183260 RepID=A0ABR2TB53_9ROSI